MDQFVRFDAEPPFNDRQFCHKSASGAWDTVMGYFDGNTVTAYWNYAQHFALGDNHFATMAGQSTRGALNLTVGDNYGVLCGPPTAVYGSVPECGAPVSSTQTSAATNGTIGTFTNDTDPYWDVCSQGSTAALTGRNIGDLLTAAGVTWGWFQGGFAVDASGKCSSSHAMEAFDRAIGVDPATDTLRFPDYVPHHNPFQYFASTANPRHLPPTSVAMVGKTDQAKHLYDLTWFWQAASAGNLPAVSFLKAPAYQNGHPGNSNPLDEQEFIVRTVNRLQQLPEWKDMAVIIAADDSDGWYDHVMPPIVNQSNTTARLPVRRRQRRARCALRLRAAAPAARSVALRARELREPCADRPDVDPALHRGQLARRRAHQRHLVRPDCGVARGHVRFRKAADAQVDPRPGNGARAEAPEVTTLGQRDWAERYGLQAVAVALFSHSASLAPWWASRLAATAAFLARCSSTRSFMRRRARYSDVGLPFGASCFTSSPLRHGLSE